MAHNLKQANYSLVVVASIVAIGFGIVTLLSGGQVLFGSDATRAAAGNVVAFVLWFNFITGALYVVVGAGLLMRRDWAAKAAVLLSIAIASVGVALAAHIISGGHYETRTVAAMTLRLLVWLIIAAVSCRALTCFGASKQN